MTHICHEVLLLMEKASRLFGRIMLALFGVLVIFAMGLAAYNGLESRSYLAAMALGFGGAAVILLLKRRSDDPFGLHRLFTRLGAARTCILISVISLGIHILWIAFVKVEPFSDYLTYWMCARSQAFGTAMDSTEYVAMYPHILGYSTFLAPFLVLFGDSLQVAAGVNVALTVISGVLIFCLTDVITGDVGCSGAAQLLWTFFPTKLMLNSLVFSEPLYTCMILLFFLTVALMCRKKPGIPAAVLSGTFLGLLLRAINIVRPIALILVIAYVLWMLLLRGAENKGCGLVWLIITVLMLGCFYYTGAPWDSHVEKTLGEEPASVPVYNIYVGFNEETQGQWSADDMDLLFAYKRGEKLSASEAQERMIPHLRERLESGIDFGRLFCSKLKAFMGDDELGGYSYRWTHPELFVKICMVICNVWYYFVVALAVFGLRRVVMMGLPKVSLLLPLYALGLSLAHMLVEVCNRYHYSIIPVFVFLAALPLAKKPNDRARVE